MISIVIPVYNRGDKIKYCFDSLLQQTFRDIEVIVVNDGSTDNSEEKILQYRPLFEEKEIPFSYIKQNNQGAPVARNKGAKESKGEFLLFCDADAILYPQFLEITRRALIEAPGISFVYSNFFWGRKKFKLFPFDKEKLKRMPYIHTMSLIRKKDFPPRAWDENIKKLQDWDLWLTMTERGCKGKWVNKTLFRVIPGGTMSGWLPSIFYKTLPFLPKVKKYNRAMNIIKKKHNIEEESTK